MYPFVRWSCKGGKRGWIISTAYGTKKSAQLIAEGNRHAVKDAGKNRKRRKRGCLFINDSATRLIASVFMWPTILQDLPPLSRF
jgi:hypothetical protein